MTALEATSTQRSIWTAQLLMPDAVLYNVGGYARLPAAPDQAVFCQAIRQVITGNEMFGTRFAMENRKLVQYFDSLPETEPEIIDFNSSPAEACLAWMAEDFAIPFNLHGPLFRTVLLKCSDGAFWYVKIHHLLADGYTLALIFNSVGETYNRLCRDADFQLSGAGSLQRFLLENQGYRQSPAFEADARFWKAQVGDERDENLFSPPGIRAARVTRELDQALFEKIQTLTAAAGCSVFHFCIAVIHSFFSRVWQANNLIIGLPLLNRSGAEARRTMGTFINVIPFALRPPAESHLLHLLQHCKTVLNQCIRHQRYTAFDLQESQNETGSLYRILFSYQKINYNNHFGDMEASIHFLKSREQTEDIMLHLIEHNEAWNRSLMLDYREDLLSRPTAELWLDIIINLMERMTDDPEKPVSRIPLLSNELIHQYIRSAHLPPAPWQENMTVTGLFRKQCRQSPGKTALEDGDLSYSYRELDAISSELAFLLMEKGMEPGHRAGILAPCSAQYIIALLAILKAGGAYIPIDPATPGERIKHIVADSEMQWLLYDLLPGHLQEELNNCFPAGRLMAIPASASGGTPIPEFSSPPSATAYILYTSGSTGQPKGVAISHASLLNYTRYAADTYIGNESGNFPLFTSVAFDLTITSIFPPLITGNTIIVYRDDNAAQLIQRIVSDKKTDIVKLTPTHLRLIPRSRLEHSRIRCLVVGGENLETSLAAGWMKAIGSHLKIFNEYGPTETTVGCTTHLFRPEQDSGASVPIGLPVYHTEVFILDEQQNILPPGAPGEICIAGAGLSPGYINLPELTAARFLAHPFHTGEKIYASGDRGRLRPDGVLEYLGRIDEQVKINGYRIEPAEIESHLNRHRQVIQAKATCRTVGGQPAVCVYYQADEELSATALRNFLRGHLPHYMMPSHFIRVHEFPVNHNGKLDLPRLPMPVLQAAGYEAPRNEIEKELVRHWEEVLQHSPVGIHDNFFELGGDSIKAVQIISLMGESGISLSAGDLLRYESIAALDPAARLQTGTMAGCQEPCTGEKAESAMENWFFGRQLQNPHYYHQSLLLQIHGGISTEMIIRSLHTITGHHDALRMNYNPESGRLFFNSRYLSESIRPAIISLRGLDEDDRRKIILSESVNLKKQFNIEEKPLLGAAIFESEAEIQLLIVIHHLAIDGYSWRILLHDLQQLWLAEKEGRPPALKPKTASLQQWEAAKASLHPMEEPEKTYWENAHECPAALPLHQKSRSAEQSTRIAQFTIDPENTGILLNRTYQHYRTDISNVLLTALAGAIYQLSGRSRFRIFLENHGRYLSHPNVSRTIGWFTHLFPLELNWDHRAAPGARVAQTARLLESVPEHGAGYGRLYFNRSATLMETDILFNYLGQTGAELDNALFSLSSYSSGPDRDPGNRLPVGLELNMLVRAGLLTGEIQYNPQCIDGEEVEKLKLLFIENVKALAALTGNREEQVFQPDLFGTLQPEETDLNILFK